MLSGTLNTTIPYRGCADCPQVQSVTRYEATEPDELLLEESDVINVFRKVSDGKLHVIHYICRNNNQTE